MELAQQQHVTHTCHHLPAPFTVLVAVLLAHTWCYKTWVCGDVDVQDFYSFSVTDISGNYVSLEKYRGKVSLVVNVASQCGYTDGHYKTLVSLQEYFAPTNKFNVLAFPCNQFGQQEPGTDKDILEFAQQKMGSNFPLFAKINVRDENVPPAWTYLTEHSGQTPTWNFWKYLVDHTGHVINVWGPSTSPNQLYEDIGKAISSAENSTSTSSSRGEYREEF